jgi:hypothetical protein
MKKFLAMILLLFPLSLLSQEVDQHIHVHFYPYSLSPQDILQDGPDGKNLDIREDTFLVWVDMFPGMFFTHETAYILFSKQGVRIEKGDWWPVLNGKMILYNEHGQYALISPFELPSISAEGFLDEKINIHVFPHLLTARDRLADGPLAEPFQIDDNCLFIWIDLLPGAFFAHPTAYVLISQTNIQIENGNWWPTLNGQTMLYGQPNKMGILSPFKVVAAYKFKKRKIKRF